MHVTNKIYCIIYNLCYFNKSDKMAKAGTHNLIVYSTQRPEYPTFGSKIKGIFKDPAPIETDRYLHPADRFLNSLKFIGAVDFEHKIRLSKKHAIDETFGEYPFMLAGYSFITRDNIIPYFCELATFEHELSADEKHISDYLRYICMNPLHASTAYYQYAYETPHTQQAIFARTVTAVKSMFSVFTLGGHKQKNEARFFSKAQGISDKVDAYSAAIKALDGISEKLGGAQYFFASEPDANNNVTLRSLTDLIVYCYLKEMLEFSDFAESTIIFNKEAKYANLRDYLFRFEAVLKTGKLHIPAFKVLDSEGQAKIAEKFIHKPMVDFPLGSRIAIKDEEDNTNQKLKSIWKKCIVGSYFLGLSLLSFVSDPHAE